MRPRAARFFSRLRIQRMPSGSRPLTGSSSSSTAGSPSSAAAMPSRWAMPRENLPARRSAAGPIPVISSTSSTRWRGIALPAASAVRWAAGRAAGVEGLGLQQRADFPQRPAQLVVTLAVDPGRPGVRPVQAEDHPHRGGLAGAVRAEEARHRAGPDVEAEVIHGGRGAVALDQAACLDHEKSSLVVAERARPPSGGHARVHLTFTLGIWRPARYAAATPLGGGVCPRTVSPDEGDRGGDPRNPPRRVRRARAAGVILVAWSEKRPGGRAAR